MVCQTVNDGFNNMAAKLGGVLNTNCPESPDTMSIMEWFWRTIGEMATVIQLYCGLTEKFWEEATLNAFDIYSHVPSAKANRLSMRQSPS